MRNNKSLTVLFVLAIISFVSCIDDINKEVIATGEAIRITETTAEIEGFANLSDDMTGVSFGIVYSTNENPEVGNGKAINAKELDGNNKFHVKATSLAPGTTYYYKAFLNADGYYRVGQVKSFTTKDFNVIIKTKDASNISVSSASIEGEVKIESTDALKSEVWFLFSDETTTLDALKSKGKKVSATLNDSGVFSAKLSSLKYDTQYFYVACTKVRDREYFGEVKSFNTPAFTATVTTNDAENISLFAASFSGAVQLNTTEQIGGQLWFLYSSTTKDLDGLITEGTKVNCDYFQDNVFITRVETLKYNTTYYYVACARYFNKDYYGNVKSFHTGDFSVNVSSEPVSNLKPFSVTLNSKIELTNADNLDREVWYLYAEGIVNQNELEAKGQKVSAEITESGTFSVDLNCLSYDSQYSYAAYAKVYDKVISTQVQSFNTPSPDEIVDMGLSVKWRSWNLGATKPEGEGDYYCWGETDATAKYSYNFIYYALCYGSNSSFVRYNQYDNLTVLKPSDDAATVILKDGWRMPTDEEFTELRTNCSWTLTSINGVKGYLAESKKNKNAIFFPLAGVRVDRSKYTNSGHYWSSSLRTDLYPQSAWSLSFDVYTSVERSSWDRCYGLTIRPVKQ